MKINASSFSPKESLDGKCNFKRYYRIKTDGSIFERILLDIPNPEIREHIVFIHYLKNYVRLFCDDAVGIRIVSRDKPWDFKIELSNNQKFNIEITSIADNTSLFIKNKKEERHRIVSNKSKIAIYELKKINEMFPNSIDQSYLNDLIKNCKSKNELIDNPLYEKRNNDVKPDKPSAQIFYSMDSEEIISLAELIKEAINKKEKKNHSDKESTVLIIDNRTIEYEIDDFLEAVESLNEYFESSSFKEIWFYTGYYSENNGSNAEYDIAPIKVTNFQYKKMLREMAKHEKNENNQIFLSDKCT